MKNSSAFLFVALAFFISSTVFAQDPVVSKNLPKGAMSSPKAGKPVTVENIEKDVAEALSVIESNHYVGNKINYNEVFKSSIDGMLHSLDPHSNYFDLHPGHVRQCPGTQGRVEVRRQDRRG